jgi:hypothetical protein
MLFYVVYFMFLKQCGFNDFLNMIGMNNKYQEKQCLIVKFKGMQTLMWNNTVLTNVEHSSHVCLFTTKKPHHPHCSTTTHIWPMHGNIT